MPQTGTFGGRAEMREISISQIHIGKRLRKDIGNIQSLADSIEDVGLLHPIVIDDKGSLIAGLRRIKAAKKLGWRKIDCNIINLDGQESNRIAEINENTERKDFTASEIAAITDYVEKTRIGHRPEKGSNFEPLPKGKTNIVAAKITGVSHQQIAKIKKLAEAAKTNPQYAKILKTVDDGQTSVDAAIKKITILENKKLPKIPLPDGQVNLILWDPSWPHDNEVAGGSGTSGNAQKYRPETIEEMKNKGLQTILAKDAILGIWTLPTFHSEVLEVIQNNGFEKIKTKIYWDKMEMKMGFNFRNSVEELCICVRGNVKAFWQTDQPNIIHQKPERPHSRKPDIFFDIMEKAAKTGLRHKLHKLEINATKPRPGWITVGNQLEAIAA
jgi:N6-adenosine-specific RNA methylase IME4